MIVVDCSAIVDALTAYEGTDRLRVLLGQEEMCAPSLLDYEVVAALRGLTLGGEVSAARAGDALTDFNDLAIQRWEAADVFRRRAFDLRDNVSAYDGAYVVLAEALDCRLVTRDKHLAKAARSVVDVVVL